MLHLALEVAHCHLEDLLAELLVVLVDELFAGEGTLHGEYLDELLLAAFIIVLLDDVDHAVPDGVRDVHADALTHQGVTAFRVDHGALLVHDVVVLQQAFTNAEVVFLDLLLGTLYLLGNHRTLQHLALLETELVHDGSDTLRTEQAHQLVLQRDEEQ